MLERHSASYGWSAPTEGRTVSIICRIALPDGWTQLRVGPAQGTRRWASDRYVNLNPEEARALIEEIAEDLPPAVVHIVSVPDPAVAMVAFTDREQAASYQSRLPAADLDSVEILDRRRAQPLLQRPRVVRCPSC